MIHHLRNIQSQFTEIHKSAELLDSGELDLEQTVLTDIDGRLEKVTALLSKMDLTRVSESEADMARNLLNDCIASHQNVVNIVKRHRDALNVGAATERNKRSLNRAYGKVGTIGMN